MNASHVCLSVVLQVMSSTSTWRDPSGSDRFEVTVPIDALDAINVNKLIPAMLTSAKQDFQINVEHAAAEVKASV